MTGRTDFPAETGTVDFEMLSPVQAQLGESPVWSPADQAIWWIDIDGHKLFRTGLDGRTAQWDTPEVPGFVHCIGPQVLVGMQSGIFGFDPGTRGFDLRAPLNRPGQRFNDACPAAHGCLWVGTMDVQNRRANGGLWHFDPVRNILTPVLDGFRTINGLAWDAPRQRLFVSDSHPDIQSVWTCAVDAENRAADRTVFARFDGLDGRPDGAAMDADGWYWIAAVDGGALYRFSPDGARRTTFAVPQTYPTKPLFLDFGGPAMALTSKADHDRGGHLALWRAPPCAGADPGYAARPI